MNKLSTIENQYKQSQQAWKAKIKAKPTKAKRFWSWVWYLIAFPFIWIWFNFRDWHTMLIFVIVMAVVSIEVWLPYLLGVITWGSDFSKWCLSIGSACWVFWLMPATPFIPLCIVLTIGIKAVFNKMKGRK